MINGVEYGFQDIQIRMLGKLVAGCTGVNYKYAREKKNIYGRGKKPIARGYGNETYEGSLTLLQSEVEALKLRAGAKKKVTDIGMFDIVVSYVPDDVPGGVIVTETLLSCEFTEVEKAMKSGDMNQEITLPLIIGDID